MLRKSPSNRPRAGFTLVELLVVISIMVVLIGLTTAAVMKFRVTGPRVATRSNVQSMKTHLDTQWKAVNDKARTEAMPSNASAAIVQWFSVQSPSITLPPSDPRVRSKYVELKLAQAFPVSFDEVMNPQAITPVGGTAVQNPLPAWPAYVRTLSTAGVTPGVYPAGNCQVIASVEVQQAVCLMMILQSGPKNADITPASLGTTGAKQLVLRNGQLVWGCVDAFDPRPETGAPSLPTSPASPASWKLQTQPGGPLLFTRKWQGLAAPTPGILSAGPDRVYGVDPGTCTATNPNAAADSISSPPLP